MLLFKFIYFTSVVHGSTAPQWARDSSLRGFTITHNHTTPHHTTPHSIGPLRMSDQSVAETST